MQVMVGQNYGSYTFDASTGVITLSGLPAPLAAGQVKLIINAATNIIIFNLADPTLTAVVSEIHSTITLTYNTTAMSDLDPLQIIMEVPIYETVSVDNFPSTQAISGSVSVSNLPSTQAVSGSVSVSNFPASQVVTGVFWQTTQPVSGSVDVSSVSGSVAVTGTFWQTTQPISGSVSITGTPAISGTVTANQGVASVGAKWSVQVDNASAIAVSDSAAETSLSTLAGAVSASNMQVNVTNTSIPVTGTFYPVTQPVSGTVAANLQDGNGTIVNSLSAGTGANGILTAAGATSFIISTANSTTTQLAASATFTGTIESIISAPYVSIIMVCDQPGILTVNQYITNSVTTLCQSSVFTTSSGGFARSIALNGNYFSLTFQNTGSITTTTLNLNTAFGNITPATQLLNSPCSLNEINGTAITGSTLPVSLSNLYTDGATPGPTPTGTVMMGQSGSSVLAVQTDPNGNLYFLPYDNSLLDTETVTLAGPGISYSTSGYQTFSFQFSGLWAGNIRVEGSNDNLAWFPLFGQNASDGVNLDVFYGQGIYAVPVCSIYMRYNVLEITGILSVVVVGKFAAPNDTPLLAQSFDATTGVQMNTNVVNQKTDSVGALVLSDAPTPIVIGGGTGVGGTITIDTQGYQSLTITTQAMAANVTCSNDKVTWSALSGSPLVLGAVVTAVAANLGYSFPCIARYIRFVITASGSATVFLRNSPWQPTVAQNNLSQVGGTGTVNAGVAGVLSVGGNIGVGVAQTTNPLVIGGIDAANLTRRLQTDALGRPIIASIDPSNTTRNLGSVSPGGTMQNIAALAVQDLSQFEGQSLAELMAQILIELRILNYYEFNLPALLTTGTTNSRGDEPSALRSDPMISTVFG